MVVASLLPGAAVCRADAIAGQVVNVTGKALVRNEADKSPQMRQLKAGDSVDEGTVINTASSAGVKLLMADKSIIDIGPSTLFKVREFRLKGGADRVVDMSMGYGQLRASVNTPVSSAGKFNIRTKTATMGVRGTEFVVLSNLNAFMNPQPVPGSKPGAAAAPAAGTTQIAVIHGKVEVTKEASEGQKAQTVALTDNKMVTVTETDASSKKADKTDRSPAAAPPPEKLEAKTITTEQSSQLVEQAKEKSSPPPVIMAQNTTDNKMPSLDLPTPMLPPIGPGTLSPTLRPSANPMLPVSVHIVFIK